MSPYKRAELKLNACHCDFPCKHTPIQSALLLIFFQTINAFLFILCKRTVTPCTTQPKSLQQESLDNKVDNQHCGLRFWHSSYAEHASWNTPLISDLETLLEANIYAWHQISRLLVGITRAGTTIKWKFLNRGRRKISHYITPSFISIWKFSRGLVSTGKCWRSVFLPQIKTINSLLGVSMVIQIDIIGSSPADQELTWPSMSSISSVKNLWKDSGDDNTITELPSCQKTREPCHQSPLMRNFHGFLHEWLQMFSSISA